MNKLNKKGFTLIEMLVVIAIIAVLVSIIIPTVTSATDKAAAATNAANLRSIKAELVTAKLTNDKSVYTFGANNAITVKGKDLPKAKKCDACDANAEMYAEVDSTTGDVLVYFADGADYYGIKEFADYAEGNALVKATPKGTPAKITKAQ